MNETTPTPWGSSPAYYDTCRMVNVTGIATRPQVVARGVNGLEVWELNGKGVWKPLATLSALSDANGWNQEKYWASIQYANLDGSASGQQEVVARGPDGVVVYKYDTAADRWVQLPSTKQLALTDDPWGSDPSYYYTFRLGDASGDGRQDTLIARGPYGIRTWFYGLPGQTGWSTYAAPGYPDFPGTQNAAYATANQLPAVQPFLEQAGVDTIRDYWSTENAPSATSLASLQSALASAAGCSSEQTFAPPQYQSCTPPASSTGFNAQDWTTVANELLSEAWAAQQVVTFYGELDAVRQKLFIAEGNELPAIAGKLSLDAAENTPTSFNMVGMSSAMLGIAASVTFEFPELSAALWVASEIVSMLPSASPDLTNPFDGTYNQLQNVFASGISQTQKALDSQSLEVRSDLNLLRLVAQLRQRGTWAMDDIGVESASNQGFALSIYKTLMPLMYTRYEISGCKASGFTPSGDAWECTGPSAAPGVAGSPPNFAEIGTPPPVVGGRRRVCQFNNLGGGAADYKCSYQNQLLDSSIATPIWGLVSTHCDYRPGSPDTAWTFGNCNLGVNPATSIYRDPTSVKENWDFPTRIGDPTDLSGDTIGSAAAVGTGSTSSLGRAATVSLSGTFTGVQSVDLSQAGVVLNRVLYEAHGPGELLHDMPAATAARVDATTSLPPALASTTLHPTGTGTFSGPLSAVPGQLPPSIELKLTPDRSSLAFQLTISNVAMPALPAPCALATIVPQTAAAEFPLTLELTLDQPGRQPQALSVSPMFSCQRDRTGAIGAITVVQPRRPKLGRGLSVLVRHPDRLRVGERGTLTATVDDRTRSTAYDVLISAPVPRGMRVVDHSPGLIVKDGVIARRLTEVPEGKSKTIRVTLVPTISGRQCTTITATAVLRDQSTRQVCIDAAAAR